MPPTPALTASNNAHGDHTLAHQRVISLLYRSGQSRGIAAYYSAQRGHLRHQGEEERCIRDLPRLMGKKRREAPCKSESKSLFLSFFKPWSGRHQLTPTCQPCFLPILHQCRLKRSQLPFFYIIYGKVIYFCTGEERTHNYKALHMFYKTFSYTHKFKFSFQQHSQLCFLARL